MSLPWSAKPELILVNVDMDPIRGSEAGKGWWWACALSEHFQLHVITTETAMLACRNDPVAVKAGWIFHPIPIEITTWTLPQGYLLYWEWLTQAMAISQQLIRKFPICGLCHVILGSFRMLPRYDQLGIPYSLGPLGGGECAPWRFTWARPAPWMHRWAETMRPVVNNSFALWPPLRACLGSAKVVLTTSKETERVVRRMGAKNAVTVFPDAYDQPIDVEKVTAHRALLAPELEKRVRLIWQGSSFWWKGPDLALMILRRAVDRGLRIELTMVSRWDTDLGRSIQALAQKLDVTGHIRWLSFLPRGSFLEVTREHHGFLATSLHDSGGIPLIEAQAMGVCCLTPGFGGHRVAACPVAGVSQTARDLPEFVEQAVDRLARWQKRPDDWLKESKEGISHAQTFTINRLKASVAELIVPAFKKVDPPR